MRTVTYSDTFGAEHQARNEGTCEYCGSPVNAHGEAVIDHTPEFDVLTKQAVCRIILRLWDSTDMCEVAYFRIVLGRTTGEIAAKLGKTRQAVNHLLVKAAKQWPELERLLFERAHTTTNRKIKSKGRKLWQPRRK